MQLPISASQLARVLLKWYRRNRRQLPWREHPDPYRVWVSEVMLQQTQVQTVVPYYDRWLRAYPTLESLARADEEEVLALWSGLGYYQRARNLHRAARLVCERHQGEFPHDFATARKLPGVGRYTAGAILSIACHRACAAVDGNVRRLMIRYLKIQRRPDSALNRELWKLLEGLVEDPYIATRISDFNQALMELGALVCRPRSPACSQCPLSASCRARAGGVEQALPRPARARPVTDHHFLVSVITRRSRFLFHRSREEAFLKGLWELPKVRGENPERASELFERQHGMSVKLDRVLPVVCHRITSRKLHFHPLKMTLKGRAPRGFRWLRPDQGELPVSTAVRKILSKSHPRPACPPLRAGV